MHKSPSDRIGSNYTPTSKHLRIKGIRDLKRNMQLQRYAVSSLESILNIYFDISFWAKVSFCTMYNLKNDSFRRQKLGLGPSFVTTPKIIAPSYAKPSRLTRTKTPSKYFRSTSPTSSSVIVEVSSIKKDEIEKARKDSVELSMEEKRVFGGQEAAAEKLRSRLVHLQKRKDEDVRTSVLSKFSDSKVTDVESFMSRFPYKSCQRSVISDLRRKRSLSLPRYCVYNSF